MTFTGVNHVVPLFVSLEGDEINPKVLQALGDEKMKVNTLLQYM